MNSPQWNGQVHPVADLFPMLATDELKELAADIKQRGLLQPIMLDAAGRVLDGRNRLAACELAGVEPRFERFVGEDADGFALAVNGQRREMNKRQKALVGARAILGSNLELEDQQVANALGVTKSSLSEALVVARHVDLTSRVLAGTLTFSAAMDQARTRDAKEAEERAAKEALDLAAPDLLALVEEERMSLDDAVAALEAREEKARRDAAEQEERERREAALADRVAKLPADLGERVNAGTLDIAEAESVVSQRTERLKAWAEKIRAGLDTLARMAGNPIPADLKEHLTADQLDQLATIVNALENGASR